MKNRLWKSHGKTFCKVCVNPAIVIWECYSTIHATLTQAATRMSVDKKAIILARATQVNVL